MGVLRHILIISTFLITLMTFNRKQLGSAVRKISPLEISRVEFGFPDFFSFLFRAPPCSLADS